ncbi:hypothetical protein WN51_07471 [Melipona quadrifasciata]|uniref:Uncharacterized protein n=1 Tax=Melipona quadrifasciata TaxID=166423 RepID=A0A0M9A753_9HYME|nr:hypothetical protein WN51_07471 [Melipona quadrifasciata]
MNNIEFQATKLKKVEIIDFKNFYAKIAKTNCRYDLERNIPSFKEQHCGGGGGGGGGHEGKGKLVPGHLQATWERHDAAVAASYGHKSRNSLWKTVAVAMLISRKQPLLQKETKETCTSESEKAIRPPAVSHQYDSCRPSPETITHNVPYTTQTTNEANTLAVLSLTINKPTKRRIPVIRRSQTLAFVCQNLKSLFSKYFENQQQLYHETVNAGKQMAVGGCETERPEFADQSGRISRFRYTRENARRLGRKTLKGATGEEGRTEEGKKQTEGAEEKKLDGTVFVTIFVMRQHSIRLFIQLRLA